MGLRQPPRPDGPDFERIMLERIRGSRRALLLLLMVAFSAAVALGFIALGRWLEAPR